MPRRKHNAEGAIRMRLGPLATKLVLREADGRPVTQHHLEAVLRRKLEIDHRSSADTVTLKETKEQLALVNDHVFMIRRLMLAIVEERYGGSYMRHVANELERIQTDATTRTGLITAEQHKQRPALDFGSDILNELL